MVRISERINGFRLINSETFSIAAFEKLLKYIESNEPNAGDLAIIKDKYFD